MNVHKNARLTPHGRERIARQVVSGQTPKAVGEAAGVCPRTVRKWVSRYRSEGGFGRKERAHDARGPYAGRRFCRKVPSGVPPRPSSPSFQLERWPHLGRRTVQSCACTDHAVASEHTRLDVLAAGYTDDNGHDAIVGKIHVGDRVICSVEGISLREMKWLQMSKFSSKARQPRTLRSSN
jgi:transposase-like protein